MKRIFALLVIVVMASGCAKKIDVELQREFTLRYDEIGTIGKDLKIKFNNVIDTRCTTGDCGLVGEFIIGLKINNKKVELTPGSETGLNKASHDGYDIELTSASPSSPSKKSDGLVNKKAYSINLIVRQPAN